MTKRIRCIDVVQIVLHVEVVTEYGSVAETLHGRVNVASISHVVQAHNTVSKLLRLRSSLITESPLLTIDPSWPQSGLFVLHFKKQNGTSLTKIVGRFSFPLVNNTCIQIKEPVISCIAFWSQWI